MQPSIGHHSELKYVFCSLSRQVSLKALHKHKKLQNTESKKKKKHTQATRQHGTVAEKDMHCISDVRNYLIVNQMTQETIQPLPKGQNATHDRRKLLSL